MYQRQAKVQAESVYRHATLIAKSLAQSPDTITEAEVTLLQALERVVCRSRILHHRRVPIDILGRLIPNRPGQTHVLLHNTARLRTFHQRFQRLSRSIRRSRQTRRLKTQEYHQQDAGGVGLPVDLGR